MIPRIKDKKIPSSLSCGVVFWAQFLRDSNLLWCPHPQRPTPQDCTRKCWAFSSLTSSRWGLSETIIICLQPVSPIFSPYSPKPTAKLSLSFYHSRHPPATSFYRCCSPYLDSLGCSRWAEAIRLGVIHTLDYVEALTTSHQGIRKVWGLRLKVVGERVFETMKIRKFWSTLESGRNWWGAERTTGLERCREKIVKKKT